jgi:hypothetical protein
MTCRSTCGGGQVTPNRRIAPIIMSAALAPIVTMIAPSPVSILARESADPSPRRADLAAHSLLTESIHSFTLRGIAMMTCVVKRRVLGGMVWMGREMSFWPNSGLFIRLD